MNLRDFSLKRLFIISLAAMAVCNLVYVLALYPSIGGLAGKVNAAGNTRMLSQRILLNISSFMNSANINRLESGNMAVNAMDEVILSFEKGGKITSMRGQEVAPPEDMEEITKIEELKSFWEPYRGHSRSIISGAATLNARSGGLYFNSAKDSILWESMQNSFFFLETNNEKLLSLCNELAFFYTNKRDTQVSTLLKSLVFFATAYVVVLVLIYFVFTYLLFQPLERLTVASSQIAGGDYHEPDLYVSKSEVGRLGQAFYKLLAKFTEIHRFTQELGKDNFAHRFDENKLSQKDIQKDELLQALLETQRLLKKAESESKQKQWISEGTALFAEVIRQNTESVKGLCQNLLSSLVKYLNANQGAIMILRKEGDEEYLSMEAQYAYSRKKYADKKMSIGDGLAGQIFLEKESLYMTNVPDDYVEIQSALGSSNPTHLLIVPIMNDHESVGVLEVASFHHIKKYQIELVERVCDSLANAILNVDQNEHTKHLLQITQQKTEQLRAAEEEMRQNMEELAATQEAMHRQSREAENMRDLFEQRFMAIDKSVLVTETDLYGTITYANDLFCSISGYQKEEVVGRPHNIVRHSDNPASFYKKMWEALKNQKGFEARYKNKRKDGSAYWIRAHIVPIVGKNGQTEKYMAIRYLIQDRDDAPSGEAFSLQ